MCKKILFIACLSYLLSICASTAQSDSYRTKNSLSLSGTWKITWADGSHGPRSIYDLATEDPALDPQRYIDIQVPSEIHDVFRKMGLIGDPNYGVNTSSAEWVALQYYQYYRKFTLPTEAVDKEQWLVMDQLDLVAEIFINGISVGKHKDAFYPCRINVTGKIKEGENILTIALESGLYDVSEKESLKYGNVNGFIQSIDKRQYQRKPQYQFNWDWNPRYINVGITGDVRLEWENTVRTDQLVINQEIQPDLQKAKITVRNFMEGLKENKKVEVSVSILENGQKASKTFPLIMGLNGYDVDLEIEKPKLWWPVGQGDQFRYTIKTECKVDGIFVSSKTKKIGIRRVEVDQSPHPEKGTYFTIKINNRPIFMKGACWVPPDMVYSKVTKGKLDSLVNLALKANFNMIRVWGGGIYAGNDLLDICDEKGLLVSHDFMFACSIYPGDDKDFYDLVSKEATWIVRELSYHPSLIVWMGNNEIEGIWQNSGGKSRPPMADYSIYHHLLPRILETEISTGIFYWPTSPYSENNEDPQSPYFGDQHPWGVTLSEDDADFYAYRNYVDRFADEGGVLGASTPATINQMMPKDQQYVRSYTWNFHDNLVNYWNKNLGISYRSFEFNLGKSYDKVPFDDYLFGSALLQSEGLQEYIYNYRRRKFSSSAAIFWMFNDSWPVTNGWTIIDYYLRKKLDYHPVRRAFDQLVTVVTKEGSDINVYGVNDQPGEWKGSLRYGIFTLKGAKPMDKQLNVKIAGNQSVKLATFPAKALEMQGINLSGAFALLQKDGNTISQNKLLLAHFTDLTFNKPTIHVKVENGKAVFESDTFVWGVTLDINGESDVADNCFDLLPGIPYSISWPDKDKQPVVLKTGNELLN